MATDGPTPPPCDEEIFRDGSTICVLYGASNAVENWVKAVASKAEVRMDWHYSGGRANVLFLGSQADKERALQVINEMADELKGRILSM